MSPDLIGVLEGAKQEMEGLLRVFRRHGMPYARAYGEALLEGRRPPSRPLGVLPRGVCLEIEAIVENECQCLPRRLA